MTLRNRNKDKSPVPTTNSSLEATNDTASTTKLMIGNNNTVGDDQKKDEANTGDQKSSLEEEDGVGRSSSSVSLSTEGDETLTRKKLPRVILRLGKPPDVSSV
jgi:hypothetical protein